VRFYTYVSTLLHCLDAAADCGIEFVRPRSAEPAGGERVEGPVSDPRDAVPASLVNMAPGPLVHGLTTGEMPATPTPIGRRRSPHHHPMKGW